MTDDEWFSLLSKPQKREMETLQWELCEQGFGDKSDFKMLTCWKEAARRLRQKYPNPDPDKQNADPSEAVTKVKPGKPLKKKREPKPKKEVKRIVREQTAQLVDFT